MCTCTLRVAHGCRNCASHCHTKELRATDTPFSASLKPLLHLHPVRLISKDLWESGQLQYGESPHMCGFELSTLSLWLSRRENVSWKPETSAPLLIIFDEQIGMYSFLLGHMLHNSFHWKLFYTLWKKTLLPSQEHRR